MTTENSDVNSNKDLETNGDVQTEFMNKKNGMIEISVNNVPVDEQNSVDDGRKPDMIDNGDVEDVKPKIEQDFHAYSDDKNIYKKYNVRKKKPPKKDEDEDPASLGDTHTYKCKKCNRLLPTKTGLLNHMRIHIMTREFTCSLCKEKFLTNKDLIAHKNVHKSENRIFDCAKCDIKFKDHCEYLVHEYSHAKQNTYKCVECGFYSDLQRIQLHIGTHFDTETRCKICNAKVHEYKMKKHMHKQHKYQIKCVECSKICANAEVYKQHMRSHTGVKPFQCLYCGRGFVNSGQRNVHMKTHTEEREFECNVCGHKSRQKIDYVRHKQTHETVKKFQCDYCNKEFRYKTSLLYHIRIHTGSRLFPCTICKYNSVTKQGLRTHILHKHTNKWLFNCDLCNAKFKTKNHYNRHTLSKSHLNKTYGAKTSAEKEQ